MKAELKKIILHRIEIIQAMKKGKIEPEIALFNEIWNSIYLDFKTLLIELKSEGKIEVVDTINQSGFKIKEQ